MWGSVRARKRWPCRVARVPRALRLLPLLVGFRVALGAEHASLWRSPNDPAFVPGPCPASWHLPDGVDSAYVRCGTVTVPQRHGPEGIGALTPVILSIVVYSSPSARAGAAPV